MTHHNIPLTDTKFRLGYHLMAPSGWINDPNGFCYFKGYYHIFYQYHPYSAQWGPMHWGHARSKDLVHWESLPAALIPGDPEDKDGCFSGSAVIKDDTMYLFYTGHHYYGDGDPEHFWQNQNLAYSHDGLHFQKYAENPIIATAPEDNTHHFRDPKVWMHENAYYMILGSQNLQNLGRAILYRSKDLKRWEYVCAMSDSEHIETEGFMWECPDFFHLNGKDVLLFSPQGIKESPKAHLNLYNLGYFVGDLDYTTGKYHRGEFKELDKGFDFYATQTMETPDGRRIAFAWMAMWESNMPEQKDGWAGALTIPRELTLKEDHLYMQPVKELAALRKDEGRYQLISHPQKAQISSFYPYVEAILKIQSDKASTDPSVVATEILNKDDLDFQLSLKNSAEEAIVTLSYKHALQEFTLTRNDREDARFGSIMPANVIDLQLFIDKSSLEIFINGGETVFSTRFYSEEPVALWVESTSLIQLEATVYELHNDVIHFPPKASMSK